MAVAIIILAIVAVMMIGLGAYMFAPINYDLYNSARVQNMTGSSAQSADLLNQIADISIFLFLGVVFVALFARGSLQGIFN